MTDEIKKNDTKTEPVVMPMSEGGPAEEKVVATASPAVVASGRPSKFVPRTDGPRGGDSRPKNPRKSGSRDSRPRNEFEQKMLNIRRVARVLLDTGLPGLPVVDEQGMVTGFVSRSDILRAVVADPPLDLWT